MTNPLDIQIGGNHYKKYKIQPVELYNTFELGFGEANIIKYSMRHQDKNGVQDLEKISHYCDLMIGFNKPVGKPIPIEYIESFCNLNDISLFAKNVLEELSLWLTYESLEYLNNVKALVREELSKYK